MHPTPYPDVNALLELLLAKMKAVLGEKLVGLYLYGSLVLGDFDHDSSDIDLLAALSSDLTPSDFDALDRMHTAIIDAYPHWVGRIEIAYLSVHGLQTFKTESSKLGIISPGEPFHIIDAGIDWLMNWYVVRTKGVTLYGPPPQEIIAETSKAEYVDAVRTHILTWRDYIEHVHSRPSQAYTILTLCRGLYTFRFGEQPSKPQAAHWAADAYPEWASLINDALVWRQAWRDTDIDHEATLPETRRFMEFVLAQLA